MLFSRYNSNSLISVLKLPAFFCRFSVLVQSETCSIVPLTMVLPAFAQREAFVKAPSSRGAQMFLQWFVETQAFELFLQERVERLRQLAKTPQHHLLPKGRPPILSAPSRSLLTAPPGRTDRIFPKFSLVNLLDSSSQCVASVPD